MLPRHADIVIIGAGVIGAAVAYYLGKEKIRAVVLEKAQVGSGSSGACEGLLLLQSKKPGTHLEMAVESLRRFQTLSRELENPIEFENKGGLVVIESEEELAAMQQFVEKQKKHGVDISLLSQAQARQTEPALSEKIVGATFSPRDSQVNPILLTRAFLHAAQKTGTTVFADTPVRGIESAHGRVAAVLTDKGRVATGVVVNATGASAAAIGGMVNLPIRGPLLWPATNRFLL